MRKPALLTGIALLFVVFTACAIESSTSPIEGTVRIPNSLGFGSDDDGVLVQFVRVENDSRCPADVECVRAGEAFVVLSTTVDGRAPQETRSEMIPGGQASFDAGRFTVTVLELRPDPPTVGGVTQGEYEILLRIEES